MLLKQITMDSFNQIISKIFNGGVINIEEYFRLNSLLEEQRYRLDDLGISSRNYNYIRDEMKLMPTKGDKREVADLDAIDFIWLRIIQSLKKFGFEKEQLQELRKILLADADVPSLPKIYESDIGKAVLQGNAVQVELNLNPGPLTFRDIQNRVQNRVSNSIKVNSVKFTWQITFLRAMVLHALTHRYNCGIFIWFENDKPQLKFAVDDGGNDFDLHKFFPYHYVYLNFWTFIEELLSSKKTDTSILKHLPSEMQRNLLDAVKTKTPFAKLFLKETEDLQNFEIQESRDLPIKSIIEKTIYEHPDQDLLIKMRNGEKKLVKQTIYLKRK